jgi:signal transduction histidine kinase
MTQVFINILSNARKYCISDDPQMQIKVRQRKGMVEVDFIDNGKGIPRDKQALIFEKFSRLTDSMQAGGAGLGLAICREIMHNLGGDVSYVPGQGGAAFRVSFPKELRLPERARKTPRSAATAA